MGYEKTIRPEQLDMTPLNGSVSKANPFASYNTPERAKRPGKFKKYAANAMAALALLPAGLGILDSSTGKAYAHDVSKITRTIPQIAVGNEYMLTLTLINGADNPDSGVIEFYSSDGKPLVTKLGNTNASQFPYNLASGATLRVNSNDTGATRVGYGIIKSNSPNSDLGVVVTYKYGSNGSSQIFSVPSMPLSSIWTSYATISDPEILEPHQIGVALVNPNDFPVRVALELRDMPGKKTGEAFVDLGANSHTARFLYELMPEYGRSGSFVLRAYDSSNKPALITMLTLEQDGESYASVPASPDATDTEALQQLSLFAESAVDGRPMVNVPVIVESDGKELLGITNSLGKARITVKKAP